MLKILSSSAGLCAVLAILALNACSRTPEVPAERTAAASGQAAPLPPAPASNPQRTVDQVEGPQKTPPTESPSPVSYQLPASERLVAIGDIHGDLRALRRALRLAGAIDGDDRWIAGKELTLVQTGDLIDRGDQDREVLDVIEKLEGDARAAGSVLHVLNGNHELMNATWDFRYVTPKSFASFDEYRSRAGTLAERLPDDERGRAAAFAPGAPYALKLARHLTVARIGDSLFAHGGVLPAHVDYGLDRLNREASAFLRGAVRSLPAALAGDDAPVWTRAYGAPEVDDQTCQMLARVLKQAGAKRLIVGHTVQKTGITSACQERVFRIDVGLSAFYGDNPTEVLELTSRGARILKSNGSAPARPGKESQTPNSALHSAP